LPKGLRHKIDKSAQLNFLFAGQEMSLLTEDVRKHLDAPLRSQKPQNSDGDSDDENFGNQSEKSENQAEPEKSENAEKTEILSDDDSQEYPQPEFIPKDGFGGLNIEILRVLFPSVIQAYLKGDSLQFMQIFLLDYPYIGWHLMHTFPFEEIVFLDRNALKRLIKLINIFSLLIHKKKHLGEDASMFLPVVPIFADFFFPNVWSCIGRPPEIRQEGHQKISQNGHNGATRDPVCLQET